MKYRHYKGGIYEIVCEARLESDPKVIMICFISCELCAVTQQFAQCLVAR